MVSEEISRYVDEPPDYDVQDWMKEAIEEARRIDEEYGTRYTQIPFIESNEGYRFMERFIPTVRSRQLQGRLWRAIHRVRSKHPELT